MQNSPKIAAIGFTKLSKHPFITNFEEVFIFSLLAKIGLSGDIVIKDLAIQQDKLSIPSQMTLNQTLKELQKICRTTQSRYVITGSLAPKQGTVAHETDPITALTITVRLFDRDENAYALDKVYGFEDFQNPAGRMEGLSVSAEVFNRLLDEVFQDVVHLVLPQEAPAIVRQLLGKPLSHSYQALNYMMQAQKKIVNAEKLTFLEAALKADPDLEIGYAQIAKLYRLERQYDKSVLYYRKALETSQSVEKVKAVYANEAGIGCALIGKPDLARQWWQRAIQMAPDYINPYFNIANLDEDQDRYEQAAQYFERAQALAPDDFRTIYNLARIYSKMNLWQKALAQYLKQLALDDQDPWCHSDIATCYLNLGDTQNASKHFERTAALDPQGEAGEYAKLILMGLHASA